MQVLGQAQIYEIGYSISEETDSQRFAKVTQQAGGKTELVIVILPLIPAGKM